jgi:hypothetical protein
MTEHARTGPAAAPGGGRHPRLGRRAAAAAAIAGAAVLTAGCSGAAASPDAPYVTFGLNMSTHPAAPGQPLVVGVPVAVKTGSVVLESATLVPLGHFPLPPTVGMGVVPSIGYVGISVGWPQRWPSKYFRQPLKMVPAVPLAGYVLKAGHDAVIYYAFRGGHVGKKYYVAGLRLRYRHGSEEGTVTLYQVGVDCVVANLATAPNCQEGPVADKDTSALPH